MPIGMFGGMGLSFIGGMFKNRSARKNAQRARNQALKDAKYQSPEELAWVKKQQERSIYGDENFNTKKNLALQPIHTLGNKNKSLAIGQSINQGLENSIIASEIRSKIDAKTHQDVANVAEKLALMNEEYKIQSEEKLDNYQLDRANKIRSITGNANSNYYSSIKGTSSSDLLGGMFSNISNTYMNSKDADGNSIFGNDINNFFSGDWNKKI